MQYSKHTQTRQNNTKGNEHNTKQTKPKQDTNKHATHITNAHTKAEQEAMETGNYF